MFEKEIGFIRSRYPEKDGIPLHEPCLGEREKEYVNAAMDSTFVSSVGRYVDQFESMVCAYTGARFCIAVVNGTAALHTALVSIGVKTGHEVITPPLTFVATVNAIAYCGAEPVFLDVDTDTLGLSPGALERFFKNHVVYKNRIARNKKTGRPISACLPVHLFGHPCKIDRIVDICDCYNIPVIEDGAESLGSFYRQKHTGRFGSCGIFSLNGNKIITSGGGGAVITDDEKLSIKIKHISTTARVSDASDFVHDRIGYNYRMPNLNAALACAQMERLPLFVENKRDLALKYKDAFAESELDWFPEPENAISNYWLNALVAENRERRDMFLDEAKKSGVLARPVFRLINTFRMYRHCQTDALENARRLEQKMLNIPSSVRL